MPNDLLSLATRIEALTGPDRAVDAEITILVDRRPDWLARSNGRMWFDPGKGGAPPVIRWLEDGMRRGPGNPAAWPSDWPHFTSSIDAAASVAPAGWKTVISSDGSTWCCVLRRGPATQAVHAEAATEPAARLAAALRARADGADDAG